MTSIPDVAIHHVIGADDEIFTNAPKIVNIEVTVPDDLKGDINVILENKSPQPEVNLLSCHFMKIASFWFR